MKSRLFAEYRRHEVYFVATLIAVVFVVAMAMVAWLLRTSIVPAPYEALANAELKNVFATGYLRFREDDGTPYLKVEVHNGTLWWIKKIEFNFDGNHYALRDPDAFRPLSFGALRCILKRPPPQRETIEYDVKILRAFGYPPAQDRLKIESRKVAGDTESGG